MTSRGLSDVLFDEVSKLGVSKVLKGQGGVFFESNWAGCYRANLRLRSATRVLLPILDFPAYNPEDLYNNIRKHDFTKYIEVGQTLAVDASIRDCGIFRDQRFVAMKIKDVYLVKDQPTHKYAAAVSIFMDRAIGFFVMTIVASSALIINWQIVAKSQPLTAIAFAIFLLTFSFFVFFGFSLSLTIRESHFIEKFFKILPLGEKFRQVYLSLHAYRKCPRELFLSIATSFVSQFFGTYFFYFIGQMLHVDLPLGVYLFIVPAGMIVMALPISPAGVGVGQVAFLYLFNLLLGPDSHFGATAVTLSQVIQLCWSLLGAIFYIQRRGSNASQRTSLRDEASQVQ